MSVNSNVILGIVLSVLFGLMVFISLLVIFCRMYRLRKRPSQPSRTSAPPPSGRQDQELRISVITTASFDHSPTTVRASVPSPGDDCPQCSYIRPSDHPPPSYFDVIPRDSVEDVLKHIFDPPSYAEAEITSRSLEDITEEEQLPTYTQVFDRNGCYVNQAFVFDVTDS